jgi:molybdate/tungstate transport system substrate-binding protein
VRRYLPAVLAAASLLGTGACSAPRAHHVSRQAESPSSTSPAVTVHSHRYGTAFVAFAGSLQVLDEQVQGPAFTSSTGYSYSGEGGGSEALAQSIASRELQSNVFESIGAASIETLVPRFTDYWVQFAAAPLVIAYNPHSPFAHVMREVAVGHKPVSDLFATMASPGFRLGRTDPNVDPQGQGFLLMLKLAQSQLHVPSSTISAIVANSKVFSETSLEAILQTGELDAASAYLPQAVQMHIPYVALPSRIDLGDPAYAKVYASARLALSDPPGKVVYGAPLTVDVTTINQPLPADDRAAGEAFVAYVLSPAGLGAFRKAGYLLVGPVAFGKAADLPKAVLREVNEVEPLPRAAV